MKNLGDSVTKDQRSRSTNLIEAISNLFDGKTASPDLPEGVEKIERVTLEAVRVKFDDEIDEDLLSDIAEIAGYTVEKGRFALRVIKKGGMVARVGSRSDAGGRFDLYLYLLPPEMERMSVYRKVVAEREGVLHPSTDKVDFEKLIKYNLRVVKLASEYLRMRYSK